ncbi:hypothetical protein EVAR_64150_1 [Eumeta japonica]|uniref:Uncharacterized protein n=1 Tax=Eumeta variegata TaxID=151549 RepID=A0A4C1ZSU3_EUMVA|nr:hypothetical protein EVAR_64150_1 [Eumeta japonica]
MPHVGILNTKTSECIVCDLDTYATSFVIFVLTAPALLLLLSKTIDADVVNLKRSVLIFAHPRRCFDGRIKDVDRNASTDLENGGRPNQRLPLGPTRQ